MQRLITFVSASLCLHVPPRRCSCPDGQLSGIQSTTCCPYWRSSSSWRTTKCTGESYLCLHDPPRRWVVSLFTRSSQTVSRIFVYTFLPAGESYLCLHGPPSWWVVSLVTKPIYSLAIVAAAGFLSRYLSGPLPYSHLVCSENYNCNITRHISKVELCKEVRGCIHNSSLMEAYQKTSIFPPHIIPSVLLYTARKRKEQKQY